MALPKKKSRPIVCEDIAYRWALWEDSGYDVVTVQLDSCDGQYLTMRFAHIYETGDDGRQKKTPITPKLVSSGIALACKQGWKADEKNPAPFALSNAQCLALWGE